MGHYGAYPGYATADVQVGMVVWCALIVVGTLWMRVPRAFRVRRPATLQYVMGLCAFGTFAALAPACGTPTIEDANAALGLGTHCAKALGVLMGFDLIAWVRRPSSLPRAHVTHAA